MGCSLSLNPGALASPSHSGQPRAAQWHPAAAHETTQWQVTPLTASARRFGRPARGADTVRNPRTSEEPPPHPPTLADSALTSMDPPFHDKQQLALATRRFVHTSAPD